MADSIHRIVKIAFLCLLLFVLPIARADDALFFGNSFTNRIPSIVTDIAKSKGKDLATKGIIKNGQDLGAHLAGHGADDALKSKSWATVVLQDLSLNPTHARDSKKFMNYGDRFYDKIVQNAPGATIVLYETWAYSAQHYFITGGPDPKLKLDGVEDAPPAKGPTPKFASADEMYGEIHASYAALQVALQAKDAKRKILIAPVGTAFAQCIKDHPKINLYIKDLKHPSAAGNYLAACVLYATITGDNPVGAESKGVPDADAKILQEIATALVLKK